MSNSKETIFLIEDEEILGDGLSFNFEAENFHVHWEKDGLRAMDWIRDNHQAISTIILDLMLPNLDGFEILRRTRTLAEKIPILVLSAKSMENDRLLAFELGADDYVTKPSSLPELILRVKSLVKKKNWYKNRSLSKVQVGKVVFSPDQLTIERPDGEIIELTPIEGLLIQTFVDNRDKILSREELLEKVWNQSGQMSTRKVDVFVSKLRKYIEEFPGEPKCLLSVRSAGYIYKND